MIRPIHDCVTPHPRLDIGNTGPCGFMASNKYEPQNCVGPNITLLVTVFAIYLNPMQ